MTGFPAGPEGAALRVATILADRFPAVIPLIERRHDLAPGTIPVPKLVDVHEHAALNLDELPAALVVVQNTLDVSDVDVGLDLSGDLPDDAPLDDLLVDRIAITYVVRTWLYATAPDGTDGTFDDADLARKRIALAARWALFTRSAVARVLRTTVRESYSSIGVDEDLGVPIAASWVECAATIEEDLPIEALGRVLTTAVTPANL